MSLCSHENTYVNCPDRLDLSSRNQAKRKPAPAPPSSAEQAFADSAAVFTGKVIEVRTLGQGWGKSKGKNKVYHLGTSLTVKVAVEAKLKGVESKTVSLTTLTPGSCGFGFRKGVRYLVYAHSDKQGRLTVSICSRTRRLTDRQAQRDLNEVRTKPNNGMHLTANSVTLIRKRLLS